ncbi:transporter substrate-binding domain-containing protein [Phytopseudomonas punonensis]|uniref:Amino acid ABC transporter substrate-binding protein, PAAT family n=1 Tax=Phytopseudomonas punonensis TaxID=1220495 RepID=A0A1M7FNS0_9GAMM|nr:transporter substrate-binding domain-containing protein [Pseudomonas punonensis]SHM05663.1 amino acid ABC transporter substrate-binding protein, PAAT family [Pseudomonas punonensis]
MKTFTSRFALTFAALTLGFGIACSASADTLDEVKAKGKLVVAIDPTFAPYEYTDDAGNIVGYAPEIMKHVAARLGVQLEYQKMAFSGIIPALIAGSVDAEGSSLNVTAERADKVLFTVPFGKSVNAVLVRADEQRIAAKPLTVESLAGLTAAVKTTTAPEQLLKQFNTELKAKGLETIKIVSVDSVDQTLATLMTRRADFVFDDITVLGGLAQKLPGKLKQVGELGDSQWISWATRKDDERLNQLISDEILALKASGELQKLQQQYLGVTFELPSTDFIPTK